MIWVIIPAYNEEVALPETLRHLLREAGDYEVFVVDGGSEDRTREITRAEPRVRMLTAPRGRASQMNAGAYYVLRTRPSPNDWLLFLHADTQLPAGALQRLNALEANPNCQAGGFLHRFAGDDWRLRLISYLDNLRCRWSRIIYGDQALFVRLALFERLGGFPDQPVLEDVAFSEKLVRYATPVLLSPPVLTDPRKFVKMGIWRSLLRAFLVILCIQLHLPFLSRTFFRDVR